MFVGRIVVADDVDLFFSVGRLIDQAKKLQPLLMSMALLAQTIDFTGRRVERGK
jgi:hypothetical protein